MHSGYGGVSEIQQQFMVDASAQSPFSISSTQINPSAASPSVTAGAGQELQHLGGGAAPFYKLINPFHPPSPPPSMQFPHFHSVPITQQLFSRQTHPGQHDQHPFQLFHEPEPDNYSGGGIMPSLLAANMNFKLGADDSSGSGIFQDDDASESRFRPWHRQEDCHIKEPFWRRPPDLDCINRNSKRYKEKEPEEPGLQSGYNKRSQPTELFFSELEAIYRPGGSTDGSASCYKKNMNMNMNMTNQTLTGSGSALTGDDRPIMPGAQQHPNSIKSSRQKSSSSRMMRKKVREMESISAFLSGLVKRLMDHQEALHQKFIDEMERRERERAGREETWREQEVVRARRDAAARANDRALTVAREATIISFVEKITGETLTLPQHHSNNYCSQLTTDANGDMEKLQDINAQGPSNIAAAALMMTTSRWPRSEVEALIRVRSGLEWRFQEPGLKGPLWEEVSTSMAVIGYQRSAKRCKEKWENINKYFRKAKDSGRMRSRNSKTCPYFRQLDLLYSNSSDNIPPPEKNNSDLLDDDVVLADDHDHVVHP